MVGEEHHGVGRLLHHHLPRRHPRPRRHEPPPHPVSGVLQAQLGAPSHQLPLLPLLLLLLPLLPHLPRTLLAEQGLGLQLEGVEVPGSGFLPLRGELRVGERLPAEGQVRGGRAVLAQPDEALGLPLVQPVGRVPGRFVLFYLFLFFFINIYICTHLG